MAMVRVTPTQPFAGRGSSNETSGVRQRIHAGKVHDKGVIEKTAVPNPMSRHEPLRTILPQSSLRARGCDEFMHVSNGHVFLLIRHVVRIRRLSKQWCGEN